MSVLSNASTAIMFSCLLTACGGGSGGGSPAPSQDFPASLLSDYTKWTPVLDGDAAFASSGHSGQIVRVYFNDTAAPHFKGEKELPFAPGSYVAKVVVPALDSPTSEATRVYFMLKKESGFDSEHADWSYALALKNSGSLTFDGQSGSLSSCYGCHRVEANWDYVRTVDYYREQEVN